MICIKCSKQYVGNHKCRSIYKELKTFDPSIEKDIVLCEINHTFFGGIYSPYNDELELKHSSDYYRKFGNNSEKVLYRIKTPKEDGVRGKCDHVKFKDHMIIQAKEIFQMRYDIIVENFPKRWIIYTDFSSFFKHHNDDALFSSYPGIYVGGQRYLIAPVFYEFVAYHEPMLKFLKILKDCGVINSAVIEDYEKEISQ